jgi:hypothetical protein
MFFAMPTTIPRLLENVPEWARTWGVPGLETRLAISFSTRMTRSLGRCHPERKTIRLACWLREAPEPLLVEVMAHETAHVAVHELHGRGCRPHGREWQELMRSAGFRARARIPEEDLPAIGRRIAHASRRRRTTRWRLPWRPR